MSAILMAMTLTLALAHGRRFPLPPLPVKDGCFMVAPELELFHLESEAVAVSFPAFRRALTIRKINPPDTAIRISKGNHTHNGAESRVRRFGPDLWLLPARPSDSGKYTITFRNTTYCIRGSVTLRVYAALVADVKKLSYEYNAALGENVTLKCPVKRHLSHTHVRWSKDDSDTISPQTHRWRSLQQDAGKLRIPAVRHSDAGLYTCRLGVLVERVEFPLTRTFRLLIKEPEFVAALIPPMIISPLNGSVQEASHGSGLEVTCTVKTACKSSPWTAVWWWVDGVQVDESRLKGRLLQPARREIHAASGCWVEVSLVVVAMTEEEEGVELTCVAQNQDGRQEVTVTLHVEDSSTTWLVVGCVSTSCFLTVLSMFLYVLIVKPKLKKKNADYFLARQDSAC